MIREILEVCKLINHKNTKFSLYSQMTITLLYIHIIPVSEHIWHICQTIPCLVMRVAKMLLPTALQLQQKYVSVTRNYSVCILKPKQGIYICCKELRVYDHL